MKQLVVLVGLPGSGKTAYQREHPDWVVVSRAAIRQTMFRLTFDPAVETTVDRVFHAALIEAVDSCAEVVCVDEPNLAPAERARWVEVARLAGRQPIACVMPEECAESSYERMQRNLKRLAVEQPHLRIPTFPRAAYDALAAGYEPVGEGEGFAEIRQAPRAALVRPAVRQAARVRPEREPLPLFSS